MAIASPDAFEILKQASTKTLTNQIANASLDAATTGWAAQLGAGGAGTTTISRDTGTFHSTPAALKCIHDGSAGTQGISSPGFGAVNGDYIEASIWINGTAGRVYQFAIPNLSGVGAFLNNAVFTAFTLAGGWQKIKYGGRLTNASAAATGLWIRTNSTFADTFYVDDLTMILNPSPSYAVPIDLATDTGLSSIILPSGEASPVL